MEYSRVICSVCVLGSCFSLIGNAAQDGSVNSPRGSNAPHNNFYQAPVSARISPNPVNVDPRGFNPAPYNKDRFSIVNGYENPLNQGPRYFHSPFQVHDWKYQPTPKITIYPDPMNLGPGRFNPQFSTGIGPSVPYFNPFNFGPGPLNPSIELNLGYETPYYQKEKNAFLRRNFGFGTPAQLQLMNEPAPIYPQQNFYQDLDNRYQQVQDWGVQN